MQSLLKIGIVTSTDTLAAWQFRLVEQIVGLPGTEICLHLNDDREMQKCNASSISKWHLKFDRQQFVNTLDAEGNIPLAELPFTSQSIDLQAFVTGKLEKGKLPELLIWLSPVEPPGSLYPLFPSGIWMHLHGKEEVLDDTWLGYWEFAHFKGIMQSSLLIRQHDTTSGHLYKTTKSMVPALSIARARNKHFWKVAAFMSRALQDLMVAGSAEFFRQLHQKNTPNNGHAPALKIPGHIDATTNVGRHWMRMLHKTWKKLNFKEQWILMLAQGDSPNYDFKKFKKILPPKDRFWADPFLIVAEGKQYLFFEELMYDTFKGHISVAEINAAGELKNIVKILEQPFHLSYPFVFNYEGIWYMIPEAYQSGAIQLYESTNFPYNWRYKMNLMEDVCAMDSTLLYHDNMWWLFTALTENDGASHHDELFLFYAETPLTDSWQSHPMNPIISDVSKARPAGKIFMDNGRLVRPSQDCSRKYGFGFHLNEIEILSKTDYREKSLLHVRPDWDAKLKRTHSFAYQPGVTVIDALIQRRKIL